MAEIIKKTPLFYSLDIETLDNKPTSPVVEIGICVVSSLDDKELEYDTHEAIVPISLADPRINLETFKYHLKSENGVNLLRDVIREPDDSVLSDNDIDSVWGQMMVNVRPGSDAIWYMRGPQFDQVILEHNLSRDLIPWKFWNVRDLRTLDKVVNLPKPEHTYSVAHRAGADAEDQARLAVRLLTHLHGDNPTQWAL